MTARVKYLLGILLFPVFNRIELRYLCPVRQLAQMAESWRVRALRLMGAEIGRDSWVRAGLFITAPRFMRLGDRVKIGPRSELYLYDELVVGNDVEIGSGLVVHTAEHRTDDPSRPLSKQGAAYGQVVIGDDVYVGSRVTILKGVSIGGRSVIAAGAVVVKDLEGGHLYAGIPAKPVRKLDLTGALK